MGASALHITGTTIKAYDILFPSSKPSAANIGTLTMWYSSNKYHVITGNSTISYCGIIKIA